MTTGRSGGLESIQGFIEMVQDGVPYNVAAGIATSPGYNNLDAQAIDYIERLYLQGLQTGQRFNARFAVSYVLSEEGRQFLNNIENVYSNALASGQKYITLGDTQYTPDEFLGLAYQTGYSGAVGTGETARAADVFKKQSSAFESAMKANQWDFTKDFATYQEQGGELDFTTWYNESVYQQYKGTQGYAAQPIRRSNYVAPTTANYLNAGQYGLDTSTPQSMFETAKRSLPYYSDKYADQLGGFPETRQKYEGEIKTGETQLTWEEYAKKYLRKKLSEIASPEERGYYSGKFAPRTRTLNY